VGFTLDERLALSSHLVTVENGIQVRLADDARYAWLLLVPEIENASELHDLADKDRSALLALASELGAWMKATFNADKINTAMIGNLVPQLHLHIVARHRNDEAWPGPIWGHGTPQPRRDALRADLITDIGSFLRERDL